MLDIKWIREYPQDFDLGLKKRGIAPMSKDILELDQAFRTKTTVLQEKQSERNSIAKAIGLAKSQGHSADELFARSQQLKDEVPLLEQEEQNLRETLEALLARLPNMPAADVPLGENEKDNVELRTWGTPATFSFEPRRHFDLGEALRLMDFEKAAALSGARFVILKGDLAHLERALANFMLDHHTQHFGYTPVSPPLLVRDDAVFGTGQLPKFSDDLFQTKDGRWLIPTAEVPLTNLVRESILDEKTLPHRYVALTPCFRSEAGSSGKDTRGMIRNHQFYKVELVSITHPDASVQEHERMTKAAESILQHLNLPYRVVVLCTQDMGATALKTYDLEVWLPGEDTYREISSCSNVGDFQARRMQARFREESSDGKKGVIRFVHTLNGSGIAVGRALVAVLENYQQEDGSVVIPQVLRPYMQGQEVIKNNG